MTKEMKRRKNAAIKEKRGWIWSSLKLCVLRRISSKSNARRSHVSIMWDAKKGRKGKCQKNTFLQSTARRKGFLFIVGQGWWYHAEQDRHSPEITPSGLPPCETYGCLREERPFSLYPLCSRLRPPTTHASNKKDRLPGEKPNRSLIMCLPSVYGREPGKLSTSPKCLNSSP